jgi:hypothetical protein
MLALLLVTHRSGDSSCGSLPACKLFSEGCMCIQQAFLGGKSAFGPMGPSCIQPSFLDHASALLGRCLLLLLFWGMKPASRGLLRMTAGRFAVGAQRSSSGGTSAFPGSTLWAVASGSAGEWGHGANVRVSPCGEAVAGCCWYWAALSSCCGEHGCMYARSGPGTAALQVPVHRPAGVSDGRAREQRRVSSMHALEIWACKQARQTAQVAPRCSG